MAVMLGALQTLMSVPLLAASVRENIIAEPMAKSTGAHH